MRKPLTNRDGEVRELGLEDFKRFKPASKVMPPEFNEMLKKRKQGERGPQKSPTKEQVTIRLSKNVLDYFKKNGQGWQSRIDETLVNWVENRKKAA